MIIINPSNIAKYGGVLNALNHASFDYVYSLLKRSGFQSIQNLKDLDRIILHIDPHLDEYFASLLFLSSLPQNYRNPEYMETTLTKEYDNQHLDSIVQNAAIFGIGSVGNLGKKALFNYDEHVQGKSRRVDSCTELVKRGRLNKRIPNSIYALIQEINSIDSSGGAHEQHIANIIKRGHEVRLMLVNSVNEMDARYDWLSPFWKWSIMNCSITAIIYCLEVRVNLDDHIKAVNSISQSLEYFFETSGFQNQEEFMEIRKWLWGNFRNQNKVFDTAVFGKYQQKQNFLLGRVCVALHHCFGDTFAQGIMMHFWEILYYCQRQYLGITKAYSPIIAKSGNHIVSNQFGYAEKREIKVHFEPFSKKPLSIKGKLKALVFFIEPLPSVTSVNQALNSLLKEHHHGFGFMYIWNSASGSVALFKSTGIPFHTWRRIKDELKRREPGRWHDEGFDHFILNGNKTHQYVERTNITLDELEKIIEQIH